MAADRGAAALLREVGLLPDGPGLWGRPITSHAAGVYVVELPEPLPAAPLDLTRIGTWLQRLPGLELDGERPSSRELLARLAALWLPGEVVLYVGGTTGSVGGRVLALAHHTLGDRRPHADGQWLHALRGIERCRIWWAETDAPEEHLDALLDAFAAGAAVRAAGPGGTMPGRPAGALLLPWATTRRPTGERQRHGLTGSIAVDATPVLPAARVVELPPGGADGTSSEVRGTGTVRRGPRPVGQGEARPSSNGSGNGPSTAPRRPAADRAPRPATRGRSTAARIEPVPLTRAAHARLEAELDELVRIRRPEIVARIKAARELGDLRENAEYHAAREEQSFLEGRIRLLEERKRHAVLIDEPAAGRVALGSVVVVEHEGETITYAIVGTTDADPRAGRISSASPVGAALLGAEAGHEIEVRTPRGTAVYRVVEVR